MIEGAHFRLLPPEASTIATQVDRIAIVWTVFSAFILLLVFGMILGFSTRYYHAKALSWIPQKIRNRMEWTWTTALLILGVGIGIWADWVYFDMHVPPADATPVYVVAKQWMWKVQHEDGTREIDELHVPVGEPVKLIMSSQDVIHSFYVPAFRIKQDVLPGRYTYLWFKATTPGEYHLFCAEFCGTSHSAMRGKVTVMAPADFEAWKTAQVSNRAGQSGTDLASRGRDLFTTLGCVSCHGTGGKIAPQLEGLYMRTEGLRTGEKVLADENYLRESIVNPGAKIVEGYENVMPSFQGQINEEDLLALIAYIKSLQYGSHEAGAQPLVPPEEVLKKYARSRH
jgi:cytochrome c oxidase subunit 2